MATLLFKTPVPVQPKMDNRFIVEFPEQFNIEPWVFQSITKPRITLKEKTFNFFNIWKYSTVKSTWSNIEMTMLDPIGPSSSAAIKDLIEFCDVNQGDTLFSFTIKALDPTGIEVETWTIDVESLVSVDFGSYDYSKDGIQKITMILKPSDCRLS